ncbi:hypothetical protein PHLGIDRAFT_68202, partial [Phlebiopsis gigantea 11061_1 CR5-6]
DGRYHTACHHFIAMSTRVQDCMQPICLFSARHIHPIGCKSSACHRLMSPPQRNPIRISDSKCADCLMRERDGMIGYV